MARLPRGIGFRLFTTLLTLTLILFTIGGYAFYAQSESILQYQILASLSNTASLQELRVNDAIESEIKELDLFTQRVILTTYIQNYLQGDDTMLANITESLTLRLNTEYYENIYLIDNNGVIYLQAKEGGFLASDAQNGFHARGSNGFSICIRDFGYGPHLYVCGPLILRDESLGVIVFEKNTDVLGRITEASCVSHHSEETVLAFRGSNGEARFFSKLKFGNATTTVVPPDELNVPMIQALKGNEVTLINQPDYHGVPVLAATRYIEAADIGLVTKIDVSEAYTPIYEVRNRILLIGSITLIVIVVFSYFFSRGLSQPIVKLKEEVEKVGHGELYVSEVTHTGDEIGALGSSFMEMVEHLRSAFDQIKQKNQQLESLNKELEAFSYSVSHDLRAPLRSIDGFSKILLEDYDDKLDDTGRDHLHRVRVATQRMSQLIDDMLALSRITQMSMRIQDIDLSKLAQTIADEYTRREPGRTVEWRIQQGLTAKGDEALLKIAITNLMDNAWKFTSRKEKATIEIGSAEVDGEKAFYIRDDGAGFDMQYVHKLFTPFQRLHTTDIFPGTGIGLAIVQRVINRHSGRVWAEGEEGKGSTFYFTITI
jgi:signal transduction histidine kinase